MQGREEPKIRAITELPDNYSFKYLKQKQKVSIATVLVDKGLLARFTERNDKLTGPCPKNSLLYNYHRVGYGGANHLVVVECPWGVMRLAQLRIPAESLLGTSMSEIQFELLRKAELIVLMMDGDRTGQKASHRIKSALEIHTSVRTFYLPPGYDPDDLADGDLAKISLLFLS